MANEMRPNVPLLRAGAGMQISLLGNAIEFSSTVAPLVVARITGQSGVNTAGKIVYTWEEMIPDATGGEYIVKPGGLVGDGDRNPALELNDAAVESGLIVFLRERGVGTDNRGQVIYEFVTGGGAGGGTEIILITGPIFAGKYPATVVRLIDDTWTSTDAIFVSVPGNQTLVTGFYYPGIFQENMVVGEVSTPVYGVAGSVLQLTVVTDITCTDGVLTVTKQIVEIPGGRVVP